MSHSKSVQEFEAAWRQLLDQLATQEERINALEAENKKLRKERDQHAAEKALYLRFYKEQLDKEYRLHPEEVEAEWQAIVEEAERNPGDLEAFIQELEADAQRNRNAG